MVKKNPVHQSLIELLEQRLATYITHRASWLEAKIVGICEAILVTEIPARHVPEVKKRLRACKEKLSPGDSTLKLELDHALKSFNVMEVTLFISGHDTLDQDIREYLDENLISIGKEIRNSEADDVAILVDGERRRGREEIAQFVESLQKKKDAAQA